MRGMKYRSDIDGLRAVAILPVVAYHAGLAFVPGGFVGVDVFFVISGYLICRLINDEIKDGSFTVAAFYKRRVMRLFPALFAMLLATSALAYFYLAADRAEGILRQHDRRRDLRLEHIFCIDDGLLRRAGGNQAAVAHLVALGRGAVLHRLSAVHAGLLPVLPQAPECPDRDRRAAVVRRRRAGLQPKPDICVFPDPIPRLGAAPWRLARHQVFPRRGIGRLEERHRRRRPGARALCRIRVFARYPAAVGDGDSLRRHRADHSFERKRHLDRRPPAVVAACGLHRPDFLFALPLALADHGVPSLRRIPVRAGVA